MVKKGMLLKDQAVRSGSVAWIKRHFALRPWLVKNINSVSYDAKGSTALHLAAEWGQLEMCAFLMEKGADPRSDISTKRKKDKMKETAQISISPLGSALLCQTSIYKKVNLSTQKDIIKMFILDPNDINAENSKGSYMLQLCERLSTHYVKGVEDLAVYCFDHFQVIVTLEEKEQWLAVAKLAQENECTLLLERLNRRLGKQASKAKRISKISDTVTQGGN